jgi:gamma-glutamyltranspeptidase / glutathione hydrolase
VTPVRPPVCKPVAMMRPFAGTIAGARSRGIKLLFLGLSLCVCGALYAQNQAPEAASGLIKKQDVQFAKQGVAAANPIAAQAGHDVLRRGGSAVDAMIATQLMLGLVEPQSSGIGGGAFLLVHDAKRKRLVTFDARETAPAAAKPERFIGSDGLPLKFYDAVVGGKSVGVPGTVALLAATHAKYGRLPWKSLFEPAIEMAERGFPFSQRLQTQVRADRFLKTNPAARAYFYDAGGEPWRVGHLLKNPDYAATLRAIADRGPSAFYTGEIASNIVSAIRSHANPGDMTEADLGAYRVIEREPVCGRYRGLRVCGMGPPSSGGIAVAQILAYVERFPLSQWGPNSVDGVHVISEAGRLAFADRNRFIADPDFVAPPRGLLDPAYLKLRSGLIDPAKSMRRADPGSPDERRSAVALGDDQSLEFRSTSHISIIDRDGNAVSMTTTIEDQFGARMLVHGFLLNNELTDFSMLPQENGVAIANNVQPGKRPRSSMAPTIIYDRQNRPVIITGSPGGSAIINYVAKSIIAMVDWGLSPQAAADLPNFGSRNGPTELESGSALVSLKSELEKRGHVVNVMEFTSGLHILQRVGTAENSRWRGGADPRREGAVIGR